MSSKLSTVLNSSIFRKQLCALTGLALVGLLQHLKECKEQNTLDDARDADSGEIVCVFPCPDGPVPYLDEYFKYLDRSDFPIVRNEEVLLNKP